MPLLVSALPSAPMLSTLLGVQVDLCDNLFPQKSSWKEVRWTSSVLRFLVVTGATLSGFAHPCVTTSGRTCGAAPITVLQCLRAARVCSVWISVDATDPDPGNSLNTHQFGSCCQRAGRGLPPSGVKEGATSLCSALCAQRQFVSVC